MLLNTRLTFIPDHIAQRNKNIKKSKVSARRSFKNSLNFITFISIYTLKQMFMACVNIFKKRDRFVPFLKRSQ